MKFCVALLAAGLTLLASTADAASKPSYVEGARLKQTTVTYSRKKTKIYCLSSTPGSAKLRGSLFLFTSFAYTLSKTSKTREASKYSKYKSLDKLGKAECKRLKTPDPLPTGNFDVDGNVTSVGKAIFGIPANLSANITTGRGVYNTMCSGCHVERTNRSFPEIREAIRQSPMLYDEVQIPDADLANLIAYLNRFRP